MLAVSAVNGQRRAFESETSTSEHVAFSMRGCKITLQ